MVGVWEDDSLHVAVRRRGVDRGALPRASSSSRRSRSSASGWLTSPDTMVRLMRDGVLDLIGAARPSIADPFLPRKIEEGRLEDIRECIGCNICVTGDWTMTPIRCTQNPSMGEEWRRGWHPGADPARAARTRRCSSSAAGRPGSRPRWRSASAATRWCSPRRRASSAAACCARRGCPGSPPGSASSTTGAASSRKLPNVEVALESEVTADEVRAYGFDHVAVATGARWRADGVGRRHTRPIPTRPCVEVLTPDDLIAGARPAGERVVLYDDDHYYLGGVLAELLAAEGKQVTLVTPAALVSEWTRQHDGAAAHPQAARRSRRRSPHCTRSRQRRRRRSAARRHLHAADERDPARRARARHRAPAERRPRARARA